MPAKTPKNSQARNATEYKRARKQMLAQDPTCEICGAEGNTIDHIRPVDTYPNPLDANHPDNLRVLCRSCNSRLGARYGNTKRAATTQSDEPFLDSTRGFTPQVSYSLSEPMNTRVSSDGGNFRLEYPRLRTNTDSGDRGLLGDLVSWSEDVLGVVLQPWQQVVLGDQLCLGEDGRPLFRQSLVSVARQQGKTYALGCLVCWWLVRMPKIRGESQTVLTTAHRLDLASELFNKWSPRLEDLYGAKVVKSYGRQELTIDWGAGVTSRWIVRAATPSAGHGLSVDLCVIDELFDCSPAAVDDALIPTMRARRDPLLSMWSTAGTADSEVMLRFRKRGLDDISTGRPSKLYFAEYSPPPELDPMSPEAWPYANPSLGTYLEYETLLEESKNPNRAAFLRASVNVWVNSAVSWLEPGQWEDLGDAGELPAAGGVLAVEASSDDSSFVGVRAVTVGDKIWVELEFVVDTLRELWQAVEDAKRKHPGVKLAVAGSLDLHLPPVLKQSVTIVGTREIQRWTTLCLSMIRQKQVRHRDQPALNEQIIGAAVSKHGGNLALSSSRSRVPIEMARAFVWAAALEGRPVSPSRAAMGSAR